MKRTSEKKLHKELAMKNEFICVASHELKTPLTALMLQVEMAKKFMDAHGIEAISPKKMQNLINRTHQDVLRLSRLVDDMMDVSRIHSGKFSMNYEFFNLEDYMEELKNRITSDKIRWKVNAPILVKWDRFRIEQVLVNLISNAERHAKDSDVDINVGIGGTHVYMSVQDYGPGISPEIHEKIFERFERGDEKLSEGFGIGLYICNEIVKRHEGKISIESRSGEGANFMLQIPISTTLQESYQ